MAALLKVFTCDYQRWDAIAPLTLAKFTTSLDFSGCDFGTYPWWNANEIEKELASMQTARVFQGELKPVLSSQETFSSHSVHNRTSSGLMLLGLDSAEIGEYFALKRFAEYRKGERLMIQCHIPSLEFSHLIATSSFLSHSSLQVPMFKLPMFWIYVAARFKAPDDVTAGVVYDLCMDIMQRLCSPDFREECKRFILIKRKVNEVHIFSIV